MFFLFGLVNLLLLLESLAVIGLGIYLWVEIGSFEVFCMVFIGLGNKIYSKIFSQNF